MPPDVPIAPEGRKGNPPEERSERDPAGLPEGGTATVAAVVIGRNEGARLVACFASLTPQVGRIVYVDSGSTDGSVATAEGLGAEVVALDMATPFTAARARNAGRAALGSKAPAYIQFVDGDCMVESAWVATARAFLDAEDDVAVACGRRRERFPEASVYNRLCDAEWDTPLGEAKACGGDALMRTTAFDHVGGFDPSLIAGEEPELCVRLRAAGWRIWRLDAEMTLHDAAMTRVGQWWQRTRRAGHAFAEGAALHGAPPDRHWVRETARALIWGAGVPLAALATLPIFGVWALLILLAWPAQILRIGLRAGGSRAAWERAFFTVMGKIPEAQGAIGYGLGRLRGKRRGLIEYK